MLTSLRKKMAILFATLAIAAVPVALPSLVSAADVDIEGSLACGTNFELSTSGGCEVVEEGATRIETIIRTVVNVLSVIVGLVAVIMIIWGGFRYITSGGDSGKITSARNTIIYAVIGLIIVALAQFLVQFVLARALAE